MIEQNYPKSISYSHAIKTIQKQAGGLQLSVETVSLEHALHRTVTRNILSPVDVPTFDCSKWMAMQSNLMITETTKTVNLCCQILNLLEMLQPRMSVMRTNVLPHQS